ncbi:MAG: hypothetical protein HN353_11545 [Bdellovibrionales bacterium]|jgi:hypothetical protein|nr:hypothetical protein [Bdellovibrionales bacterium]MBT7766907.1 hypothetical protein [Bdellovibrionales bacterium]
MKINSLISQLLVYALLSTQLALPIAFAEESTAGSDVTTFKDFELYKHMANNLDAKSDASYAMAADDMELNAIAAAGSQLVCHPTGDTKCESYPLFVEASQKYVTEMVKTSQTYIQEMEAAAVLDTGSGNQQIETAERAAAMAAAKENAGIARLKLKELSQGMYDEALAAAVDEYASKEERVAKAEAEVKTAKEELKAAKKQAMMAAIALAVALAMKMAAQEKQLETCNNGSFLMMGACYASITDFIQKNITWIAAGIFLLYAVMQVKKAQDKLKKAKQELQLALIHTHMVCQPHDPALSATNQTDIQTNSSFKYFADAKIEHGVSQVEAFPTPKTRMEYLQGVMESSITNVENTQQAVNKLTSQRQELQRLVSSFRQNMQDSTEAGQGGEGPKDATVDSAGDCLSGKCTGDLSSLSSTTAPDGSTDTLATGDSTTSDTANLNSSSGDKDQALRLRKFRKKRIAKADALRKAAGKGPTNLEARSRRLMAAIRKRSGGSSSKRRGGRGSALSLPKTATGKMVPATAIDNSLDGLTMEGGEDLGSGSTVGSRNNHQVLMDDRDEKEGELSGKGAELTDAEMAQEYEVDTIHDDKTVSIFKIISVRYLKTALPRFYRKKRLE